MTIEEAGQIVLEGPNETCTKCWGLMGSHAANGNVFNICSKCNGYGANVREEYKQACEVLGITMPVETVIEVVATHGTDSPEFDQWLEHLPKR